ncbi:enolase, partial [Striga asiatica]
KSVRVNHRSRKAEIESILKLITLRRVENKSYSPGKHSLHGKVPTGSFEQEGNYHSAYEECERERRLNYWSAKGNRLDFFSVLYRAKGGFNSKAYEESFFC